jgi:hypothetical protein
MGIGTTLLHFVASLARSRKMKFVTWECEENNSAEKFYLQNGAQLRKKLKPFRLSKDIIIGFLKSYSDIILEKYNVSSFNVSARFSIFRATTFGISGYDIDPNQNYFGIQIEDIKFININIVLSELYLVLKKFHQEKDLSFVDLILEESNIYHQQLISFFDGSKINTYSGNPSCLWELVGDGFKNAAFKGERLNFIV